MFAVSFTSAKSAKISCPTVFYFIGQSFKDVFLNSFSGCPNRWEYFQCRNDRCISNRLICDGYDHCGDNSDETSHHCGEICFIINKPLGPAETFAKRITFFPSDQAGLLNKLKIWIGRNGHPPNT